MPTFVWTDEVPRERRHYLTPEKRYPLFNEDSKGGDLIDDEGQEISVYFVGSVHLDGRAWNVETVADPAPPDDPSAELERLRAGIRAEIDWHEAEAKRLREIAGHHGAEGFILVAKARAHEAAATRLRALLPQTTPEPEGK